MILAFKVIIQIMVCKPNTAVSGVKSTNVGIQLHRSRVAEAYSINDDLTLNIKSIYATSVVVLFGFRVRRR